MLVFATLLLAACGPATTQAPATQPPATEPPMTEAPTAVMTEAPTEAMTEAPTAGGIDCMGAQSGDEVSMLYQWAGVEETSFNQVMQPLVDACGIVLKPEFVTRPGSTGYTCPSRNAA